MQAFDNQNKKILVVEDDFYIKDLYVENLKNEGYSVDSASDGEQAFQMIQATDYDLILLDLILPKMSGIAILKKLKEKNFAKSDLLKIIVLTNLGQDTVISEAISLGVRGYIIKSDMALDKLLAEVKNYLIEE